MEIPVSGQCLEKMIEFLYTDHVTFDQIEDNTLFELNTTARKFELERLSAMTENFLYSILNSDNVLKTLQISAKEKWASVSNACYAIILNNYSQILSSPDFALLPQEVLVSLIRIQHSKVISLICFGDSAPSSFLLETTYRSPKRDP